MTKKFTKGLAKVMSVVVCLTVMLTACVTLAACGDTIEFDVTSKTIYVSDTFRITATTSNEEALVEWTSSNTKVASVRRGVVTGEGEGTATITATTDSGATATCEVTVLNRTLTISQQEATIDMAENNTLQLTATSSVEGDKFTWASTDPAVATVDGGLVTAVDIGTTTITASVGNSSVYCLVTVTNSDLPADYRRLEKGQNAAVNSDPGVWYYWADGSEGSSYSFAAGGVPTYQDGGVQVTLASLTSGYFRFRYQPGGADGTGLEDGDNYEITLTVETNVDGNVGCKAGGNIAVKANEPVTVTRTSKVSASEPLYISLNSANYSDQIPAEGLFFRVSNISIKKTEAPIYTDDGDLSLGNMKTVRENPGIWFYNSADSAVFTVKPNRDAATGTLSVTTASQDDEGNPINGWGKDAFYFRYQPNEEKDGLALGDMFTITFTAQTDFDAYIRYGYEGEGSNSVAITANTPQTITLSAVTLSEEGLFFVSVRGESGNSTPPETAGTFTVSDISIEKANPVVSATVETAPAKVAYVAGETFDPTGMVLNVTYADTTTGTVTVTDASQVTFSTDPLTEGQTSVEVTIGVAKVTVEITVAAAQ